MAERDGVDAAGRLGEAVARDGASGQDAGRHSDDVKVHRVGVNREDTGYYVVCSCGLRTRWLSPVAARREAKAHRRYPDGNPRIKAMTALAALDLSKSDV